MFTSSWLFLSSQSEASIFFIKNSTYFVEGHKTHHKKFISFPGHPPISPKKPWQRGWEKRGILGKTIIEPSVLFPELTMFVEFYFLNFLPDGDDINLEILFFQNSVMRPGLWLSTCQALTECASKSSKYSYATSSPRRFSKLNSKVYSFLKIKLDLAKLCFYFLILI